MAVPPAERPIRLVVRDGDLHRSRLTVFFRIFLAIPHLVWLLLWGIAAYLVAFILWIAILIEGRAPEVLHDFVAGYLRYATHVGAYVFIAANPYPGFRGAPGYPVDLEIEAPQRQSRWTAGFRLILALPALLLASALGGGFSIGSPGGSFGAQNEDYTLSLSSAAFSSAGVAAVAAFLTWFVAVAHARATSGLRDLTTYALAYGAQAGGYLLLLTDRYPSSDPALMEPVQELPEHPVRMEVTDELERSRLTVLFRLLLAIPQLVWIMLWSIAVFFVVIAAWFAALATGHVPAALHRFLAAYVRYCVHLGAYVDVIGRRFPGFTGREGSYGIDVHIDPPQAQSRWKTLFRIILAFPALLVAGALGGVLLAVAFLGWSYSLVTGRMPEGLRNLGASCLRYSAQMYAYALLLTDRYPYAAPVLKGRAPMFEAPSFEAYDEPLAGDAL